MTMILTLHEIETAINRCRDDNPPEKMRLSAPLSKMAEVYGALLYRNVQEIDVSSFGPETVELYRTWLNE
ncbi:DUF3717 domain-containing protein [Burkholderia arboris]|uniref:DUF3717 domain-containing protein n=1 Tax=Burkholderia arboris TaxID=488730 RepID=UPI00294175DF|nr:DUF3717 domain-containing protein [Burkholderia arboris]CAJ6612940.1 Protein of uncharacterised function (DUF3717) [Burkholderia pseudomallei]CAJ6694869.1 Protein of uncharacterised function (DUF3717) [Burkholderia pseudomallei]HEP6430572.1 DUF3717 domain-containing protein [Burkholderia cenocepacia]